jgi:hypothetical protein
MSFEDYLREKKIDTDLFKTSEPARWQEWNTIFVELSPASFTAQKLYLINPIRRKYPLKINSESKKAEIISESTAPDTKPQAVKPVFRPKMK